jgi:tRNA nucleotidyltransferase/poly(A) polymerase
MSDYIYMLENRLSPDQRRALELIQAAAAQAGATLFLTGGAMRDMLAGFRIRDLDFVVEGDGLKVAEAARKAAGIKRMAADEMRKSAELVFPGDVTAEVAMSRQEKRGGRSGKSQIVAATIQEDLRGRDFTCNAIALSLNKASRGLLLDPLNGLADIGRLELRAAGAYAFYDDPVRLLRLARLQVRLGFQVEERTKMQVANALEAGVQDSIPAKALGEELRAIAAEDGSGEIVRILEEMGLLKLFSPALAGPKGNSAGLAKLEKIARTIPDGVSARLGPFLYVLTEKLSPKEEQALVRATALTKAEEALWKKLGTRARKLETALRSARIKKPSQVYHVAVAAPSDEILFLLYHSSLRQVQERLKNYFQKYLPAVQEITPEEWAAVEGKPGTPKYEKARDAFIANRLDRRPKKVVEEAPAVAAGPLEPAVAGARGPAPLPGMRGRPPLPEK